MTPQSEQEYYFVPLGRERGGLLDFFGLPYSARQNQAKTELTRYRQRLAADLAGKTARLEIQLIASDLKRGLMTQKDGDHRLKRIKGGLLKALKTRLQNDEIDKAAYDAQVEERELEIAGLIAQAEASPITREEFEVQVKQWKAEETEHLTRLNDLNTAYEQMLTRRRELEQKGLADDSVVWLEIVPSFQDKQSFWRQILERRPLPQVGPEWLTPSRGELALTKLDNLAVLRELVSRRDFQCLEWADLLWAHQSGTNRWLWYEKVKAWVIELEQLEPSFDLSPTRRSPPPLPEFPSLCELTPLAIDRLVYEELEELPQSPTRVGYTSFPDLASLLASMLADARSIEIGQEQHSATEDTKADTEAAFGDFLDFVRNALSATVHDSESQQTQR